MLYIFRDIRDVAASIKRVRGLRDARLLDRVSTLVQTYYELSEIRESAPEYFLWQRYEDAMQSPESAAREIAGLLQVSLPEDTYQRIVHDCSLEMSIERCVGMRRGLQEDVNRLRGQDPRAAARFLDLVSRNVLNREDDENLLQYNHVSRHKGASGIWREVLTTRELSMLVERHGTWLAHAGYEV